jgi:Ca2+-binding RTX toxin-like protein
MLGDALGVTVSAASRVVGASAQGGCWELDVTTGSRTVALAIGTKGQEDYGSTFALQNLLFASEGQGRTGVATIDLGTGEVTRLSGSGLAFSTNSLARRFESIGEPGLLYGLSNEEGDPRPPVKLFAYDPATGENVDTKQFVLSLRGGTPPDNLVKFAQAENGTLYAMAGAGSQALYTIDPDTGVMTNLGDVAFQNGQGGFPRTGGSGDIAFDPDEPNVLYISMIRPPTTDPGTGAAIPSFFELHKLTLDPMNPSTLTNTEFVGTITDPNPSVTTGGPFPLRRASGAGTLAFGSDGFLYLSGQSGAGVGLYKVDPANAATTRITDNLETADGRSFVPSDFATFPIPSIALDMEVDKDDGGLDTADLGDTITYTLTLKYDGARDPLPPNNIDPDFAVEGIKVTDVLPDGLDNATWTREITLLKTGVKDPPTPPTTGNLGDINDSLNLEGASTIVYTITGKITAPLASGNTLRNEVTVSADGFTILDTTGNVVNSIASSDDLTVTTPPNAINAVNTVEPGGAVQLTGLLGIDPDGDPISSYIFKQPKEGVLYLGDPASGGTIINFVDVDGDGEFEAEIDADDLANVYYKANSATDPTNPFNGEPFEYTAIGDDGSVSEPATVTMNVPPEADDNTTTIVAGTINPLPNDLLAGSDAEDVTVSGFRITSLPKGGTLYATIGGNLVPVTTDLLLTPDLAKSLVFEADPGFTSNLDFKFVSIDKNGAESDPATITLNRDTNSPPITIEDAITTAPPNATTTLVGLGGSDVETTDPNALKYSIDSVPDSTLGTLAYTNSAGTLVQLTAGNITGLELSATELATLAFTPTTDAAIWTDGVTASFTYSAIDGDNRKDPTPATAYIKATPDTNVPPETFELPETFGSTSSVPPGGATQLRELGGTDPDDPNNSVRGFKFTLPPASAGVLYLGDPNNGGRVILDGEEISASDIGNIYFDAADGYNGTTFEYTAIDNGGLADPTPAMVMLTKASNLPPETADVSISGAPDSPLAIGDQLSATDAEGDNIAFFTIDTLPASTDGILYLGGPPEAGGVAIKEGAQLTPDQLKLLYFVPVDGFSEARFTYSATDTLGNTDLSPATVNIGTNKPPETNNATARVQAGQQVALSGLGGNDSDGTVTFFEIDTIPAASQGILYLGDPANNRPIKDGDLLSPSDLASLVFVATGAFTGANFTYSAFDNLGKKDPTPATVTIGSPFTPSTPSTPSTPETPETPEIPQPDVEPIDTPQAALSDDDCELPPELQALLEQDCLGCQSPPQPEDLPAATSTPTLPRSPLDSLEETSITIALQSSDGNLVYGGLDDDFLVGDSGNDTLSGDRGNDDISGGQGDDVLYGNGGNDLLRGESGEDTLYGGIDSDRLRGGDQRDIMYGDRGADNIAGGQGDDTIIGGTSNALNPEGNANPLSPEEIIDGDFLWGELGNDLIDGNRGNDIVVGGLGDDTLGGGSDQDVIWGEGDNDLMYGDRGNDTLCGGDGDDTMYGGNGNPFFPEGETEADYMIGGWGHDLIYGNDGDDTLCGSDSNDTLYGGQGDDIMLGGNHDDVLDGQRGTNTLVGGDGNDIFVIGGEDSRNIIVDFDLETDAIRLVNGLTFADLSFDSTKDFTQILHGDRVLATVYCTKPEALTARYFIGESECSIVCPDAPGAPTQPDLPTPEILVQRPTWIDNDDTTAANEYIGNATGEVLFGRAGDDKIQARAGNDTIFGGNGSPDEDVNLTDRDTIAGNRGDDVIFGSEGDDEIRAGRDNDRVWAGKDDDLVYGDRENDTLLGELGNDTLVGGSDETQPADINGNDWLLGGGGDDLLYGNQSQDTLGGGEGNDILHGGQGDDVGYGDDGDDVIYGDRGNDIFDGGNGNDTLIGGNDVGRDDGEDLLVGGGGDDVIGGNGGNDRLVGGTGNDTIRGGADQDILWGQDGDDLLYGDKGDDTICAGDGDDILIGGNDNPGDPDAANDDVLIAGAGNDRVYGNRGNDKLYGEDGEDCLYGGEDDDTICAGDGNDLLDGQLGNDRLIGGTGNDRFVIRRGGGTDTIVDFELGIDRIALADGLTYADLTIVNGATGAIVRAGNEDLAIVNGVMASSLIAQRFTTNAECCLDKDDICNVACPEAPEPIIPSNADLPDVPIWNGDATNDQRSSNATSEILFAGDQNDIVDGGAGDDTIVGGNGSLTSVGATQRDELYGNDGNDDIYGNEGTDTIRAGRDNDRVWAGKDGDLVYGDRGNDTLHGELGDDTLIGGNGRTGDDDGDGNDVLFGGDGNDVLNGNNASDQLVGGTGDDLLRGGRGDDLLWGEAGDDLLFGEKGNDTLCGGDGNDTLIGGSGNNLDPEVIAEDVNINGEAIGDPASNDVLIAGLGDDWLFGNVGDDKLYGNEGDDRIDAGQGDDTLCGGAGDDTLIGDAGRDVFILTPELGSDLIVDFSRDLDTIVLTGGLTVDNLNLRNTDAGLVLQFGAQVIATIANLTAREFLLSTNIETLESCGIPSLVAISEDCSTPNLPSLETLAFRYGSDLVDNTDGFRLVGDSIDDVLNGGGTRDVIEGGLGDDILRGGAGDDVIFGGISSDVPVGPDRDRDLIFGNDGLDRLFGNEGYDTIYAGRDSDVVFGGKDDDRLIGDRGSDLLAGELGNDTLIGGTGTPERDDTDGADWLDGGAGEDVLYGNTGNDTLVGGDGDDLARGGLDGDRIYGAAGYDLLYGEQGNDWICGGDDDDTIVGGTGDPTNPDIGNDTLHGGANDDIILGNAGDDILIGDTGADTLVGGIGNDILEGGDGGDRLFGDFGDDTLVGGNGSDRFFLERDRGQDTIVDFDARTDILAFGLGLSRADLTITNLGGALEIRVGVNPAESIEGDLIATMTGQYLDELGDRNFA